MKQLLGASAGVVLAGWGIDILKALGPEDIARLDRVELDSTVLGFALGLSLMIAEVLSIDPNLPVTRIETMEERLAATMEGARCNMLLLGQFVIVAVAASPVPALRATEVDPIVTLRFYS